MKHSHDLPVMPASPSSELGDRKFLEGDPTLGGAVVAHHQDSTKQQDRARTALFALPRSLSFALLGVVLALGAPLGLLFARLVARAQTPTFVWVLAEVRHLLVVYAYVMLSTLAVFVVLGYLLGRWFDRVHALSITDPLTGLFNRRHFGRRLAEESMRGRRHGYSTCVLCVDVDRLKAINDGFGHKAGDHAIQVVSQILSVNVRAIDVVARIGGDEFAVLLPETSQAQALALSQRILTELARHSEALAGKLAVSIGISELSATSDVKGDDVLAAADAALYLAKTAGGGRAVFALSGAEAGRNEPAVRPVGERMEMR